VSPADPAPEEGPRILLPTPGRPREAPAEAQAPTPVEPPRPMAVTDILEGFRLDGGQVPVMVAEAAPLLNLADILRQREAAPDLAALRSETVAAVRDYERRLGAAGIPPQQARAAHYVVCATLDDVIRSRPWGEGWAVEGLVSTFHHDVTGGDKVFELLAHFQQSPGANRDLLLLIYLCLSLGFAGRTRVSRRGGIELMQTRENLYRILRAQFGVPEADLSPHWRGVDAAHEPLGTRRGLLLFLALLTLLLSALFATLSNLLGGSTDAALARMATLPPEDVPSLAAAEPPPPIVEEASPEPAPEPVPPTEAADAPPAPPEPAAVDAFVSFLQPEVEEGLVRLYRDGDAVLVRIANSGAFRTGRSDVEAQFMPLLDRIGQALAAEDFAVTVIGHTDDVPIRRAAFASNAHLSTARAEAVRNVLGGYVDPESIEIRGMADARPIATNETEEGREANRRTEILVRGADDRVSTELLEAGPAYELAPGEIGGER
jgi:type VI secretion system protein ImpK